MQPNGGNGGHHGLDISGASAGHGSHHKTIGAQPTAPSLNDKYGNSSGQSGYPGGN